MANMYMVQRPNSNSNKTKKFRVVNHQDWMDWLGLPVAERTVISAVAEFDDYSSASRLRDQLNQELRRENR